MSPENNIGLEKPENQSTSEKIKNTSKKAREELRVSLLDQEDIKLKNKEIIKRFEDAYKNIEQIMGLIDVSESKSVKSNQETVLEKKLIIHRISKINPIYAEYCLILIGWIEIIALEAKKEDINKIRLDEIKLLKSYEKMCILAHDLILMLLQDDIIDEKMFSVLMQMDPMSIFEHEVIKKHLQNWIYNNKTKKYSNLIGIYN